MKNFLIISKSILTVLQLVLMTFLFAHTTKAAGEVDAAFNTNVGRFTSKSVNALALQPDGKILVGGNFTTADGQPRIAIARFNADGSLDNSFNAGFIGGNCFPQPTCAPPPGTVSVITVQADGKLLVAGNFFTINGASRYLIARLNQDGSPDTSFNIRNGTTTSFDGTVNQITMQADGKILVGGSFTLQATVQGTNVTRTNLVRVNSDGSYDSTFVFNPPGGVADIIVQTDGKVLISGSFGSVARLNADGSPDSTFANLTIGGGVVNSLVLQSDGKIVVAGSFTTVGGFAQGRITRLNPNGTLDTTFNIGNAGANNQINDAAMASDGKIIIVGNFTTYNGANRQKGARLNTDGSLDASLNYTAPASFAPTDVVIQTDGKIVISGTGSGSNLPDAVFRINQDGSPDTNFSPSIILTTPANVYDLSATADGKVYAGGDFTAVNGLPRSYFVRLNADGSVDTNFVPNVNLGNGSGGGVYAIAPQIDGKVLVGGELGSDLQRLNADGSRDTAFLSPVNSQSQVYALAVLPDGKILVGGSIYLGSNSNRTNLTRLNADGTVDSSFSVNVSDIVREIFLQSDGKILISGEFTAVNGASRGSVARLNADGTLDLTFNPPFGANYTVYTVAQQTDGKVLIGGVFNSVNGADRRYLARFNADGSLDTSFNPSTDAGVYALTLQPNGRILIGGAFTYAGNYPATVGRYARLLSNGTPDPTFNPGVGANDIVQDIVALPDGKVLIGGHFTQVGGQPHGGLARLFNSTAVRTPFDFDGDGKADVSVFRPSNGFWYQLRSQNNTFFAQQFGQSGDLIAPADYDGDGKTDLAVWRTGGFAYFYILNSSDNSFRFAQFGTTGDVPVSGDWDGDGKADLAVYRNGSQIGAASNFYYRPSSQPAVDYLTITWGVAGDRPLTGDFDGDNKLDAAVFRSSNANWYIRQSSTNQTLQTAFGAPTDIPITADLDGDGRANFAVFRPSTGTWYTSTLPQTNYGAVQFGANGDLPVPADYDGDGQADLAVFRPSTGAWYMLRTTQGFSGVAFGDANDKPIPNAFVR